MIRRILGALATTVIVASSGAQIYFDRGQTILVPGSSVPKRGQVHSTYLLNLAPKPMPHVDRPDGVQPFGSAISGYYPADVRTAYQMPSSGGAGAIAIVDAFHNSTILADFNTFATQFGLPKETSTNMTASTNKVFQVVYASGSQPPPDTGWGGEIALDVEWAHAIAPTAKIYLVEAASASFVDIQAAVNIAKALPGVRQVSMSFGGSEWSGESGLEADYVQSGVTFFASSGDIGGEQNYPSMSRNVVGVGGTTLNMSGGAVTSETAWTGSGGGPSAFLARPTFQNSISAIVGSKRGCPDISGIADPGTGVAVFSTYAFGGWTVIGGTSLACPVMAAVANVRGSYSTSSPNENVRNYAAIGTSAFRDIKTGSAGAFTAATGWDYITGCGSPIGLLPSTQKNANAIGVAFGTYSAGALANLAAVDNVSYNTVSAPSDPTLGQYAADNVLVKFGAAPATFSKLYFYITLSTTATALTEVWAFNYTTHHNEKFGNLTTTPTAKNAIYLMNVGPAVNFFDVNNTVHLYIKSRTPGNNTTSHTLKLDRVVGYAIP